MRIIPYFVLLLLFYVPVSQAQVQSLSLEEAIRIGLENSIDLERARHNVERAKISQNDAEMDFLPNLNSNISGSRGLGRQFDQEALGFVNQSVTSLSSNIQSNVTLFNGFRNINALRQSRAGVESSEERYQRSRERVIFEVSSAYLQVLLNQNLLQITKDNVETAQKQLQQVEAQVEVGMRPVVDLFNQQAALANAELQAIRSENTLNISITNLIGILRLDPLSDYDFVSPDIDAESITPQNIDLATLVDQAMQNRSDLRATELDIAMQRYNLEIARGARYPTLSANASVSTSYRDTNPFDFSDQFWDQNINRGVGMSLSIPIFTRFSIRNNIQRQQLAYKDAKLDLDALKIGVFQEVRQAYNDYIGLSKELEATSAAFRAAERAFETEQERYNVGSATLIELTEANNRFVQAQTDKIIAEYQFVFQEKLLEFYLGRLTEEIALQNL